MGAAATGPLESSFTRVVHLSSAAVRGLDESLDRKPDRRHCSICIDRLLFSQRACARRTRRRRTNERTKKTRHQRHQETHHHAQFALGFRLDGRRSFVRRSTPWRGQAGRPHGHRPRLSQPQRIRPRAGANPEPTAKADADADEGHSSHGETLRGNEEATLEGVLAWLARSG